MAAARLLTAPPAQRASHDTRSARPFPWQRAEKYRLLAYRLRCTNCGVVTEDDGRILDCTKCGSSGLLRTEYQSQTFSVHSEYPGLFRYSAWLPLRRVFETTCRSVTYKSAALCRSTGLKNLWVSFSGYWPQLGAFCPSWTFKDLEVLSVLGRVTLPGGRILAVASAGNTAYGFAHACSVYKVPCVIVVPKFASSALIFDHPLTPCVKVVSLDEPMDYTDCISLVERLSEIDDDFVLEGGARNVGRRDGAATVLLNAFEVMGQLPEYYFQAIGSGTGAIATYECAQRISRGRGPLPKLFLSQNLPFAPVLRAWESGLKCVPNMEMDVAKEEILMIHAKVLSNRRPVYGIPGGLFDALTKSEGTMLGVSNEQAISAASLFKAVEKVVIDPAAAIAFASLLAASSSGVVPQDATILLNITGGVHVDSATSSRRFLKHPDFRANATMGTQQIADSIAALCLQEKMLA